MENKHLYKESIKKDNYTVINCEECGYWHVYPMPTEDELNNYYESKYYHNLGDNRSMTDKLDDPDGFYAIQYEDGLRYITKIFPRDLPKTIIDIGAGYGDFLIFMKNNGWSACGVEPSKYAYQNIKDKSLDIKLGNIEQVYAEFKPASLVTLNSVLEHVGDPRRVLDVIRDYLLLPRGILSIIVPNDFNILQDLAKRTVLKNTPEKQYYWVVPPEHINYWTIKTIRKFLKRCGFEVLGIITDFPMEIFLLMGDNYVTNSEIGRNVHLKRVRFEKNLQEANLREFKDLIFGSFAKLGIGRCMQVFATTKISKKN